MLAVHQSAFDRHLGDFYTQDVNTAQFHGSSTTDRNVAFNDAWLGPMGWSHATTSSYHPTPEEDFISPTQITQSAPRFPTSHMHLSARREMAPPPPPPPHPPMTLPSSSAAEMQYGHLLGQLQIPHSSLASSTAPARPASMDYIETDHWLCNDPDRSRSSSAPAIGYFGFLGLGDEDDEDTRRSLSPAVRQPRPASRKRTDRRHSVPQTAPIPTYLPWGSDPRFASSEAYSPPATKVTVESMQEEQMMWMKGWYLNWSAANEVRFNAQAPIEEAPGPTLKMELRTNKTSDPEGPPSKRRRGSKVTSEAADSAATPTPLRTASKQGKTEATVATPDARGAAAVSRRKLTENEVKPSRGHLSLKKKRENHNRCEKKRRQLINEGFDDLCELVPGMLRGGGFNKSTMLSMAADWLSELLKGNDELAAQLAALS
jgi:hypothetical protein